MSNPGEWIDFAELCRRVPGKSARTLRRYIKARLISYRQAVRGGKLEFNWRTVERELRAMVSDGANALRTMPDTPPDLMREVHEMHDLLRALAVRLNGIPAGVLGGEQLPARERRSA